MLRQAADLLIQEPAAKLEHWLHVGQNATVKVSFPYVTEHSATASLNRIAKTETVAQADAAMQLVPVRLQIFMLVWYLVQIWMVKQD